METGNVLVASYDPDMVDVPEEKRTIKLEIQGQVCDGSTPGFTETGHAEMILVLAQDTGRRRFLIPLESLLSGKYQELIFRGVMKNQPQSTIRKK